MNDSKLSKDFDGFAKDIHLCAFSQYYIFRYSVISFCKENQ